MIIPAHKIKIVYPRYQSVASLQALQSIIGLADLANPAWVKDHSTEYNYRLRDFRNSGLHGIYLGTSETLNTQIVSKYVQNPTYNSVYFDKLSKFPQYKLRENTNVKCKRDPQKADVVVISNTKTQFDYSQTKFPTSREPYDRKFYILYSSTTDLYYLIYEMPCDRKQYASQQAGDLFDAYLPTIKSGVIINSTHYAKFIDILKTEEIIPSDAELKYTTRIAVISSLQQYNFIYNIYNTYMKVIYDTDLDQFVCNQLKDITSDDLETLEKMLMSSDGSVVGLGIKLISTYNVNKYKCTIGLLLCRTWENIRYNSVRSSTAFKMLCESLNLATKELGNDDWSFKRMAAKLYNQENIDEQDKHYCREQVLSRIKQGISAEFERLTKSLEAFDFNMSFEIK